FFSSRRRHTRSKRDWSSDVCSSDLRAQKSHAQHLLFDDSTPLDPSTLNQLLSTPSTSIKSAGHSGLHLRRHRVLRLILDPCGRRAATASGVRQPRFAHACYQASSIRAFVPCARPSPPRLAHAVGRNLCRCHGIRHQAIKGQGDPQWYVPEHTAPQFLPSENRWCANGFARAATPHEYSSTQEHSAPTDRICPFR